jgi:hypothetical protein
LRQLLLLQQHWLPRHFLLLLAVLRGASCLLLQ